MMEGPSADSEEKHEPVGDIDTAAMESLKALDPERPIREADIVCDNVRVMNPVTIASVCAQPPQGERQRASLERSAK